jgi:HEAT repeat protein
MTVLWRFGPLLLLFAAAGCAKSTAELTRQLKSSDPTERLHAVKLLEDRVRDKDVVVPALTEALADENTYVRRDAAKALGQFGPDAKEAVPALVTCLRDKEPSVRKTAGESLKKIDPAAATRAGVK